MNIQQNKKQNKKSAAGTSYSNKKQRIETKCSVRDRSSCSISRDEAVYWWKKEDPFFIQCPNTLIFYLLGQSLKHLYFQIIILI